MSYETIRVQVNGSVGTLTLARPHVLNAINRLMISELSGALAAFVADPAILVIMLDGAGRAFSAGFDVKEATERQTSGVAQWREVLEADFNFIIQWWDCPKPTITAVHGHCLGGAFELMLASDITVAAEDALFGEPEVRFGSSIVALLLPWLTTPKLAKELLFTGNDRLEAPRAREMGLINRVVPVGEHVRKATVIAKEIASAAPHSVAMTKRAVNRSYEIMGMRQALLAALDTGLLIACQPGPERTEFNRIAREQGLKAAIAWRDRRKV